MVDLRDERPPVAGQPLKFQIYDPAFVEVDSFLFGGNFNFPAGTSFSSITGVFSQVNRGTGQATVIYRITPRSAGEVVVQ